MSADAGSWPPLPLEPWRPTYETLHMMSQVVGKVSLAKAPRVNHWWGITLHLTPRGLSTGPLPHDGRTFGIDLDFTTHELVVATSDGEERRLGLEGRSVARFHADLMRALEELAVPVRIWTQPVEVEDPIPFEQDETHATYEPEHARRFWDVLRSVHPVMSAFRAEFLGKSSPVHFFWGAFDLAVTRFSGRPAPEHPGGIPHLADWVTREAYSHECASAGFWPGGGLVPEPTFFAYAYPEPAGYDRARVRTSGAYYHTDMREYLLPYEAVRRAPDPDAALRSFLEDTYEAAATLGGWDRAALERPRPTGDRATGNGKGNAGEDIHGPAARPRQGETAGG